MGPEAREVSGQEMWLRVFILGNQARLVLMTQKTEEEEFPPEVWLVGKVRAGASPGDAAGALNTSMCCSREGKSCLK